MTRENSPIVPRLIESWRRTPAILSLFLVIAIVAVYFSVAHHEFIRFDDAPYVTRNVHVQAGLSLNNVAWAFTTFEQSNWHPLTWLSHMTDCQLFALKSGPHHLINVFFHTLNTLLLFFLLRRATGATWRSFLVAVLFALHPMNVETVAWVAERKSLLCMFFSLLTVAAYGSYARQPEVKKYLLVAGAFVLALLAKPMAVSLPLVLLFLDYWPLDRFEGHAFFVRLQRLVVEKIPLILLSAASCAVTMVAQRSGSSVGSLSVVPLSLRVENAIVSYATYVGKMFWPIHQSILYPFPEHGVPGAQVALGLLVMVGISAAVWMLRRHRYLVMGWCLFVSTLIPVIGLVQVGSQAMADRYAYLPYIGLFVMLAWGAAELAGENQRAQLAVAAVAAVAVLALGTATTQYLSDWQNGSRLFIRASQMAPHPNVLIEEGIADAAMDAGRLDEAYQHASAACTLSPTFPVCHFNMAQILLTRNQLRDALQQYELAATYASEKDMAVVSLLYSGAIAIRLGDYDEAEYVIASVLKISPNNPQALQLAEALSQQRRGVR